MDPFIVSARKYRPSLFKEVKSQQQVITTLLNQLKNDKIPQVVLFCGPRGTGKTSCGRLFAKAINCDALQPSGEPCNQCTSCTQFQQQTSMNIHELDAASHNSVEDARQLLEQVRFHPASGKKIFIIDEVHMLSNAAFNALLKTLEEPPAHVVFILATTEKHKITPTILSRCQIFDFYPIAEKEIFAQLHYIATQEGIQANEEALHLISEQSEGSLREALHAFDKIVAFGGGQALTKEGVLRNLQILDYTHYFTITEALYQSNVGEALQAYDQVLRLGFESQHFMKGLSKHFRNLLVAQTATSSDLLHAAPTIAQAYAQQAQKIEITFLYETLALVEQCELHYRERQDKRLHVELTLIKMARLKSPSPTNMGKKPAPIPSKSTPTQPKPSSTPPAPARASHISSSNAAQQTTTQATKNTPVSASRESTKAPLTLTQVATHWEAYREKLKKKGAMSAYTTLKSPIMLEGETIVLQIANALQKNALHSHYDGLLAFLQGQLQRPHLRVITRVVPLQSEQKKPYTSQEKLKHLIERYPAVADLKKDLELA